MTQQVLAVRAGLGSRTVSDYENGVPELPDFSVVQKLATALSVDVQWLMFGTELGTTRTERDDAKGSVNVEAFLSDLAAAGTPAPEEAARHLRGLRHYSGDVSREAVQAEYITWRAAQRDKALPPRPGPVGKIDEARGQRKIDPTQTKKRR